MSVNEIQRAKFRGEERVSGGAGTGRLCQGAADAGRFWQPIRRQKGILCFIDQIILTQVGLRKSAASTRAAHPCQVEPPQHHQTARLPSQHPGHPHRPRVRTQRQPLQLHPQQQTPRKGNCRNFHRHSPRCSVPPQHRCHAPRHQA